MDSTFRECVNKVSVFKDGSERGCLKALDWSFREGYIDYAGEGLPAGAKSLKNLLWQEWDTLLSH